MEQQQQLIGFSDKAFEMLDKLANKLGTTSEKVFETLVKQARVDAIIRIVVILFLIIVSCIGISINLRYINTPGYQEHFGYYFFLASIILCIITFIQICISIGDIITGFVNPKFNAIIEIKNWFKNS